MRTFVTGLIVTALALGATACGSSGSTVPTVQVGALSGKTASQALSASSAAARKEGSAHYVLTAQQGSQSQTISGDASATEGEQSVTQGTQHIEVIYVGGVAYVQGNAGGLSSAMGLSATVAATYAGKWIAVHSTDSLFKAIVQAVTLASTLAQLNPSGTLSITAPMTVAGRQAVGIRGGLPKGTQTGVTGSTTLYVAVNDPTVPLKFTGQASSGSQHVLDTGTFTNWGKALQLSAPAGAVAFSTLPTK
jgi:hypothetical protein